MKEETGRLFDPYLLDLFLKNIGEFVAIKDSLCDAQHVEYSLEGQAHIA
jgi:response regulator RpfG family c-di-GMP phosphodiesterase